MTTDLSRCVLAFAVVTMLVSCAKPGADTTATSTPIASTPTTPAPQTAMSPWTLPVEAAQQPDLAAAPDGSLLMSWIEQDGDMQRLWFSRWRDGRWSAPQSIAQGEGIGNGADTPHVRQTPDGALWATWLRKLGTGEARDIVLARSTNEGLTWSAPVPVNTDGTATEHGFASLWADGQASLGVAWLDGRDTVGDAHGHGHGHGMHAMQGSSGHGGLHDAEPQHATMLRTAVFDAQLSRHGEAALDTTTCDCCQTDVTVLADGPRLVYRDRAPGEIRDIALLTRTAASWSSPTPVHVDNWHMPACPVNGPAIAGAGRDVAVAWYTMRRDVPTVRFARSTDGGVTFGDAVDLASAADVQGRVDVALDTEGAWVAWLTEASDAQALHLAHVSNAAATPDRTLVAATVAGRGRATGWPRLVVSNGTLRVVWTEVREGHPVLHGAAMPVQ